MRIVIDNVNWISYREHFFSSILMFDNKLDQIQIFSENLSSIEELEKKYTKRFSTIIPIDINNSSSDFRFYFGPTDYHTLKEYDLGIENSVPVGWGIFGWINTFIFFPLLILKHSHLIPQSNLFLYLRDKFVLY